MSATLNMPHIPPYQFGNAPELSAEGRGLAIAPQNSNPIVTLDSVHLILDEGVMSVALIPVKQGAAKFWTVMSSVVDQGECYTSGEAVARNARHKFGISPNYIEQVSTVANASRRPGGWSASVLHLAIHSAQDFVGLSEAGGVELFPVWPVNKLPENMLYDHAKLVALAVERLVCKSAYSTITGHFLPEAFTLTELHNAMESVSGGRVNAANFRRKLFKYNVLREVEKKHSFGRQAQGGRLALAYSLIEPISYFQKNIMTEDK